MVEEWEADGEARAERGDVAQRARTSEQREDHSFRDMDARGREERDGRRD